MSTSLPLCHRPCVEAMFSAHGIIVTPPGAERRGGEGEHGRTTQRSCVLNTRPRANAAGAGITRRRLARRQGRRAWHGNRRFDDLLPVAGSRPRRLLVPSCCGGTSGCGSLSACPRVRACCAQRHAGATGCSKQAAAVAGLLHLREHGHGLSYRSPKHAVLFTSGMSGACLVVPDKVHLGS